MANTQRHHRGSFGHTGKRLRPAWTANPATRCWRCKLPLAHCRRHRNGRLPSWTVGHVDLNLCPAPWTLPDALLIDGLWCAPECSPDNYEHGARDGNAARRGTRLVGRRYVRIEEPHSNSW